MTTDKHPGGSGSGQSGDQSQEAVIFNPDGTVQHRHQVNERHATSPHGEQVSGSGSLGLAEVEPEKHATAPQPPGMRASGPIPPDMNPALLKRLADDAARSAEEQADELADAIYTKFMGLLSNRITEKGGNLTMDDVTEMGQEFHDQLDGIKETFLNAVESYTQAREQHRVSSERGNVFKRIMVHHFETRFANEQTLKEKPDRLSRRMLPGFYSVLSMMFGPPKLERYEQMAKNLVDRLRRETNGQIEWADVYHSPEARRLALRAEIEIAQHFKDADKRLDWMVAMINSHLIPLEDGKISSGWNFSREAAEAMLTELFHDLRTALKNAAARKKFATELGNETLKMLDMVTRRFA